MLESQKSGYIYFNCFELPSDWLLSYWESQSKGSSKQLLCRVGLWRFHIFYFCKKRKIHQPFVEYQTSWWCRLCHDRYCRFISVSGFTDIYRAAVYHCSSFWQRQTSHIHLGSIQFSHGFGLFLNVVQISYYLAKRFMWFLLTRPKI